MSTGYKVEVDKVTRREWSSLIQRFNDGNIFQTWSYGLVRWGERNLSLIVLKKDGEVVAMAQAALWTPPILRIGIAHVANGPMWRLRGKREEVDRLQQMARALREEYSVRRGLLLRLMPNEFEENSTTIRSVFEGEGFRWKPSSHRTLLLELMPSVEELRKNLKESWRRNLKKGEKNGLRLVERSGDKIYGILTVLYEEMLRRKRFVPGADIHEFRAIQEDLPDSLKMKIIICEQDGEPVAGAVASLVGNTGIYLFGASGDKGLQLRGSYLIHWRLIEWLKECGAHWYDLGGINPDQNPGTYQFKTGLAGESGKDVRRIGQFDACESFMSAVIVACGDQVKLVWRRTKICLNRNPKRDRKGYKFHR